MALQVCSTLPHRNISSRTPAFLSRNTSCKPASIPGAASLSHKHGLIQLSYEEGLVIRSHFLSKRAVNVSILGLFLNGFLLKSVLAEESCELERYTDSKEGFTLLVPCSWIKVDKAGATVLFEEVDKGSNNVGVVVNPVRLTSLKEFGSPEFVADKLIRAEKRKESTKDAQVIEVSERSGQGGLQVYELEYKLDSTRGGIKRIFTAVFVASKKLYLLNIAHSDKPESPLDAPTRMMLEQVVHSFDVAPTV